MILQIDLFPKVEIPWSSKVLSFRSLQICHIKHLGTTFHTLFLKILGLLLHSTSYYSYEMLLGMSINCLNRQRVDYPTIGSVKWDPQVLLYRSKSKGLFFRKISYIIKKRKRKIFQDEFNGCITLPMKCCLESLLQCLMIFLSLSLSLSLSTNKRLTVDFHKSKFETFLCCLAGGCFHCMLLSQILFQTQMISPKFQAVSFYYGLALFFHLIYLLLRGLFSDSRLPNIVTTLFSLNLINCRYCG